MSDPRRQADPLPECPIRLLRHAGEFFSAFRTLATYPTSSLIAAPLQSLPKAPSTRYTAVTHPESSASPSAHDILNQSAKYILPVYARPPFVLSHGKGSYVWDTEGRQYLDFCAGIAVNALGHADEQFLKVCACSVCARAVPAITTSRQRPNRLCFTAAPTSESTTTVPVRAASTYTALAYVSPRRWLCSRAFAIQKFSRRWETPSVFRCLGSDAPPPSRCRIVCICCKRARPHWLGLLCVCTSRTCG